MPLLVALVLLALACAPTEPAPTPADVPTEAAADAPAGPDGASDAGPSDAGRTDAADGSVPDTLTDALPLRDASRETGTPLCPEGMTWCGSFCSALNTTANCGGCGLQCCTGACPPVAGGFVVCASSMCTYACDDRHLDCDGNGANGCETERSRRNCGVCGRSCSTGEECASGRLCCRLGDSACIADAGVLG